MPGFHVVVRAGSSSPLGTELHVVPLQLEDPPALLPLPPRVEVPPTFPVEPPTAIVPPPPAEGDGVPLQPSGPPTDAQYNQTMNPRVLRILASRRTVGAGQPGTPSIKAKEYLRAGEFCNAIRLSTLRFVCERG